jgi:U4/U6 small nuclear ribonucleoprotein PRP4
MLYLCVIPCIAYQIRYGRGTGEVMVTSSFQGGARVWRTRDYSLLTTLSGHEGRVVSCDYAPDERRVVTCASDRTIKVWAHEDEF